MEPDSGRCLAPHLHPDRPPIGCNVFKLSFHRYVGEKLGSIVYCFGSSVQILGSCAT